MSLASISKGYLLRGINGKQRNQSMDPGQISRVFNSLAVKADLDPKQISGHSTRIGAAQDLSDSGARIGQIMARVGWSKVDTVMRYAEINNIEAMRSQGTPQIGFTQYTGPQNPITI